MDPEALRYLIEKRINLARDRLTSWANWIWTEHSQTLRGAGHFGEPDTLGSRTLWGAGHLGEPAVLLTKNLCHHEMLAFKNNCNS